MGGLGGWSEFVLGACSEAGCALVGTVEASPFGGAWAFAAPAAAPFGDGDFVVGDASVGFGELVAPAPALVNGFAPAAVAGFDAPVAPAVAAPDVLRGGAAVTTGLAPGRVVVPAAGLLAEAVPAAEG